jgi:hypothetical protein
MQHECERRDIITKIKLENSKERDHFENPG